MDPAWITAIVAVAVAVIGCAAWAARWGVRLLIGTHDFLTDWPKMKAAVAALQEEIADIKAETKPNGGSSLRDVVHRTAEDVAEIKAEQATVRVRLEMFDAHRAEREGGPGA